MFLNYISLYFQIAFSFFLENLVAQLKGLQEVSGLSVTRQVSSNVRINQRVSKGGGGGGGGILPSVQTDPQTISGTVKVILLKLFYYQTFLKLGVINIHDMNIKKMQ